MTQQHLYLAITTSAEWIDSVSVDAYRICINIYLGFVTLPILLAAILAFLWEWLPGHDGFHRVLEHSRTNLTKSIYHLVKESGKNTCAKYKIEKWFVHAAMTIPGKEDSMPYLTSEQKERFHRNGYLRYGQVISQEQVKRLRDELERIIHEELTRNDLENRPPEFAYGHDRKGQERPGQRAIHQFVNIWKVVPEYQNVIHNTHITGVARTLMDVKHVRLWHDQIISKPPGDNKHFQCHHDFYFWPLDRPRLITCWLALDDATVENGCMHVIPGSHRDPRYQPDNCELSEDIDLSPVPGGPGEPGSLYQEIRNWGPERAVPVELKAGECMFHHCLNYHMTPQNVTDRQRRAYIIIYMPDGTRYRHDQSPNHPCTNYLHLEDGAVMDQPEFPVCGEG